MIDEDVRIVREALTYREPADRWPDEHEYVEKAEAALARLEARIAEDVSLTERMDAEIWARVAAEARVEAVEHDLLLAAQQNTRLSERLDRAEARVKELEGLLRTALVPERWDEFGVPLVEPYADVPGAGQRGC